LHRISQISALCDQIESAVRSLVESDGDRSTTVASAKSLQTSVRALKRELLEHYLESRILEAARAMEASKN
jgi:hypothetical protein